MKYIVENWFVIVGLIAVLTAGGYAVYVFVKMPSDKQLNKVREWLLLCHLRFVRTFQSNRQQ